MIYGATVVVSGPERKTISPYSTRRGLSTSMIVSGEATLLQIALSKLKTTPVVEEHALPGLRGGGHFQSPMRSFAGEAACSAGEVRDAAATASDAVGAPLLMINEKSCGAVFTCETLGRRRVQTWPRKPLEQRLAMPGL